MTIRIQVGQIVGGALYGDNAYTFDFDILVIDCEKELMTLTDPGTCPLFGTFPVFLETYRWNEFIFEQ